MKAYISDRIERRIYGLLDQSELDWEAELEATRILAETEPKDAGAYDWSVLEHTFGQSYPVSIATVNLAVGALAEALTNFVAD